MSMKTNKFLRIASVLLIAVLLSTCVISGTFAKYVSSATSSDVAQVAKWDIKVNDNQFAVAEPAITFNLFDTIKDSDGTDEENVVDTKIAPGTSGAFSLTIKNDSEVDANYAVDYTVTNEKNIPIQYQVAGSDTWTTSLEDITETALDMGASANVVVNWKWVYSVDADKDVADTTLGILAQTAVPSIEIAAKLTVTQVD